jgi:hypothetical protein
MQSAKEFSISYVELYDCSKKRVGKTIVLVYLIETLYGPSTDSF